MQVSHTTEYDESHVAPGSPFRVHSVSRDLGHDMLGQANGVLQATSQLHESTQSICGQEATPVQSI